MSLFHSDLCETEIKRTLKNKDNKGNIVFLGALGAGNCALAALMRSLGYGVIAVDRGAGGLPDPLGLCAVGRLDPSVIPTVALGVYSLAVGEDDPDYLLLKRSGVPLASRAQLLGAVRSLYELTVGVSGSHGKSTVTAMLAHILVKEGKRPTVLLGAESADLGYFSSGGKDILLYEACEYKDSFLYFKPDIAVVNSVELDHVDYFRTEEQYRESFFAFCSESSSVICSLQALNALPSITDIRGRCISFGEGSVANFRYRYGGKSAKGMEYDLIYENNCLHFTLPMIGRYNLENASAAIAAAYRLGIDPTRAGQALSDFGGVKRRMERLGTVRGREVYYDYAHHPTELCAAITSLREHYGRLTVVFRPHTYTRTAAFMSRLAEALSMADHAVVCSVYAAREEPVAGADAEALASLVHGAVALDGAAAARYVTEHTDGAVLLLGAGDLGEIISELKIGVRDKPLPKG